MLVKDVLCQKCADAKVAEELKALEIRGEYHPDVVMKDGNPEDSSEAAAGESPQSAAALDSKTLGKISITDEHVPAVAAKFISLQELEAEMKGGNIDGTELHRDSHHRTHPNHTHDDIQRACCEGLS